MSNHKSTSYSNEQRLSSTHNTFLKKKTSRSFTSENSTQNESEEKQKIFKAVKSAKRENLRKHWDMISGNGEGQVEVTEASAQTNYKRLGKAEQDKDTDPMECMLTMLRMFDGLRIYRLNFEKNDAK